MSAKVKRIKCAACGKKISAGLPCAACIASGVQVVNDDPIVPINTPKYKECQEAMKEDLCRKFVPPDAGGIDAMHKVMMAETSYSCCECRQLFTGEPIMKNGHGVCNACAAIPEGMIPLDRWIARWRLLPPAERMEQVALVRKYIEGNYGR